MAVNAQSELIELGLDDVELSLGKSFFMLKTVGSYRLQQHGRVKVKSFDLIVPLEKSVDDTVYSVVKAFADDFAQEINSALEMWMSKEQLKELFKLVFDEKKIFRSTSTASGATSLGKLGWKLFAHIENGSSEDFVFYK